jgi:hypothetical protein
MRGAVQLPKEASDSGRAGRTQAAAVDRLMERASRALEAMRYFEAERLCLQAIRKSYSVFDYEVMSRILLPLQEARRQKRQLASEMGSVVRVSELRMAEGDAMPGCYLFQPPLIGADARGFRERADSRGVATFVLTREPMSLDGKWPIVSVGATTSVRTKVDPPWPVLRVEGVPTRDDSPGREIPMAWLEAAAEALGDAAIAKVDPEEHPVWRVADLLEALDALPVHEKLHQALEQACREAAIAPAPDLRRSRRLLDDPFTF